MICLRAETVVAESQGMPDFVRYGHAAIVGSLIEYKNWIVTVVVEAVEVSDAANSISESSGRLRSGQIVRRKIDRCCWI